jgi:predicted signal transduction protein with EAL and GGDEF domain
VETLEHGAALVRMGCHLVQGYGIARPMPADKFVDWCARWQSEAVWLTLGDRLPAGEALLLHKDQG